MKKLIGAAVGIMLVVPAASAAEPPADEIVRQAYRAAYYQGADGRADATMVITDAQGRTRERVLTILKLNIAPGGEQKYYVYFHKPNDVRNMVYMVWKYVGKDDDRWLFLPALDLVKRVAASDKRSSFAGTNFAYEDISGRNPDEDTYELLQSEGDRYELKGTPKNPSAVEFAHYLLSVNKTDHLPVLAQYYDREGKLYKTIEALEIRNVQGYPTVTRMKATDLNAGSSTVTTFADIRYDVGLTDDLFSERYLRKPPARWIEK